MDRTFTQSSNTPSTKNKLDNTASEPGQHVIDFIMNYSKSTEIKNSELVEVVRIGLN